MHCFDSVAMNENADLVYMGLNQKGKIRSSNFEFYRIICMLMIVAYHYLVNSGLLSVGGPIISHPNSLNSYFLLLFGAWGKVGINCFIMITGYFMCTSSITFRKFLKLILQVYFYRYLIYFLFVISGYDSLSVAHVTNLLMPFLGFSTNDFVSCFIAFWLTIPFLNILIRNMNKRQHGVLIILLLFLFSVLGSIPRFKNPINYITWFGVIYIIASYIRLYPVAVFERKGFWGWATLITFSFVSMAIVGIQHFFGDHALFLVSDSNRVFAVLLAVSSFLWFKNMNLGYSKVINAFGAGTFGVLLIHANSDTMRLWLWKDVVDCVGHYYLPLGSLLFFCFGVVIIIFLICNLLDQLRIATIERALFSWYDKTCAVRVDAYLSKLLNDNK